MKMHLIGILNILHLKGWVTGDQKGELKEKHVDKAHSDVLKWIKETLPKEKEIVKICQKCWFEWEQAEPHVEEGYGLYKRFAKAIRQKVLKNLEAK